MGLFNQEKILVDTQEFFALHQGIAEASDDPGFGLKLVNWPVTTCSTRLGS